MDGLINKNRETLIFNTIPLSRDIVDPFANNLGMSNNLFDFLGNGLDLGEHLRKDFIHRNEGVIFNIESKGGTRDGNF